MFDQVMARIAGRFKLVEPRAAARAYLLGLLSGVERKNCWQLAEQAGLARHCRCSTCCATHTGTPTLVRDDVRAYAAEHLGTDSGVLVVDKTGFLKATAPPAKLAVYL
jgi:SRSO17 transposase